MSVTHPASPAPAEPTVATRLLTFLDALSEFGMGILRRIHDVAASGPHAPIDDRGFARASRGVMWAVALRAVITGHLRITTRPRHPKPADAPVPAPALVPAPAPRAKPAGAKAPSATISLSRAMQTAFATHPIGAIAARICRTLGVTNASDLWSDDVMATSLTPAEWSATHFPINNPTPRRRRRPARAGRAAPPQPSPAPPPRAIPDPAPQLPCILHHRPPPRPASRRAQLLANTFTPVALPFLPPSPLSS